MSQINSHEDVGFQDLVSTELKLLRTDASLETWREQLVAAARSRKLEHWRPSAVRQYDRMILFRLISVATEQNASTEQLELFWADYNNLKPRLEERIACARLLARFSSKSTPQAWSRSVRKKVHSVLRDVRKSRISKERLETVTRNLNDALSEGGHAK